MASTPLVLTSCSALHGATGSRRLCNRRAGRALPRPSSYYSGTPMWAGSRSCVTTGTALLPHYRPRCLEACAHRRAVLLSTGEPGGPAMYLSGYGSKFSSASKPCLLWRVQIFFVGRRGDRPPEKSPIQTRPQGGPTLHASGPSTSFSSLVKAHAPVDRPRSTEEGEAMASAAGAPKDLAADRSARSWPMTRWVFSELARVPTRAGDFEEEGRCRSGAPAGCRRVPARDLPQSGRLVRRRRRR